MTHYVIIVAGGSGSRMECDMPKQFMLLRGKPLLMHAMTAFYCNARKPEIILIINKSKHREWNELCSHHHFTIPHRIAPGGATRFHSVKNGLQAILAMENELKTVLIAIHDGVRPLVSDRLIERSFALAEEKQTAVPAIQSPDSIRIKEATEQYRSISREKVFLVQTPQVFNASLLKAAFEQEYQDSFTDDATVVENSGHPIHLLDGDIRNIKITYRTDLSLAEYWLSSGV